MAKDGFIVINRKITKWQWWNNCTARSLFIYLLVNANWKDGYFYDTPVKRGQLLTSIKHLSDGAGISTSSIKRWLKRLKNSGEIDIKATNRYTLITIVNYGFYQDLPKEVNQQMNQQVNYQVNQQVNHNRTINNKNKQVNNIEREQFTPPSLEMVQDYCQERNNSLDPNLFIEYYTANGWLVGKNKMKDWKAAIRSWERREQKPKPVSSSKVELPDYMQEQKEEMMKRLKNDYRE